MPTVSCEVNNCTFWATGNQCAAERIHVASHTGKQASNHKETDCNTFQPEM